MRVNLIGVNHNTAPLAIRERTAISIEKLADALELLRSYVPHGVIVSTCNRTEVYTTGESDADARKAVLGFLKTWANLRDADLASLRDADLTDCIYACAGKEAAEHLLRVASGLESMVVGEYEILGQIGNALETAEKANMVNLPLRQLFQSAIRTGRRVREETGISKNALSVSSVAVDRAARIVGDFKKCRMLVIGAGEAGRLVAKVARDRGTPRIVIASRTRERAQALATVLHGTATDLDNLDDELSAADIVVACAGAPHRILSAARVRKVMEKRAETPLVLIDIAMPRNAEPEVGQIENVFLYNIDDLTEIAELNRKQREADINQAEEIITQELDYFMSWWQLLDVRPLVTALMSKAEDIRSAQLNKTLKKLPSLSDEQRESLEAMTRSIVTKILKDPINYLKTNGDGNHLEVIRDLFQLDTERCS